MNQLAVVLAVICLGLSLYNVLQAEDVRKLRTEFQQRQAVINEGAGYRDLNQRVINALANVAANSGDEAIRNMLASVGVTFKVNEPEQAPAPAAPVQSEEGTANE
jgi:hypothetical protein